MILTDYLRSEKDITWDIAKSCGIKYATIRLPDDPDFDISNRSQFKSVYDKFSDFGIKPIVIEPLPECVHKSIKAGLPDRDRCIEKAIGMMRLMDEFDIRTLCFNFMAYVGWTRTKSDIEERGGFVTGFRLDDYKPCDDRITSVELWKNYEYFIKAVIPFAEKYGIRLALHPDDPPLPALGNVERIMISADNIRRAMNTVKSDNLGLTFCQATYKMMGEDIYSLIPEFKDKIFFIHFRNAAGNKYDFRETFHDSGEIDMPMVMKLYKECGINVPIRVDHVPRLAFEENGTAGYTALGRLFAIGYLKGICDGEDKFL